MERRTVDFPIRSCSRPGLLAILAVFYIIALTGSPGGVLNGITGGGLSAEEIHLKNGDHLTGHIWRIGPMSMLLETPYATLWLEQTFVDRITVVGFEPRVRVRPKVGEQFEATLTGATGSSLIFRLKGDQIRRLAWADVESVAFYEPEKK